jgi:1,4-alpha-glucan branching enzyme
MGGEFGQWSGWNPEASLDWHLVRPGSLHQRLQLMVGDLNQLYRLEPALQSDGDTHDFIWGDRTESELSVIDWLRTDAAREVILAAFNFTPVPRHNHRVGVPRGGIWREVFNSDALEYGGSGQGNLGGLEASPFGWKQHSHSLTLTLPPLGAVFFKAMDRS